MTPPRSATRPGTAPASAPKVLLRALRATIAERGVDANAVLARRGQLAAVRARRSGAAFERRDWVRGLVLAWLAGRRPWTRIGARLEDLGRIFRDYDPKRLRRTDPGALGGRVCELRCGNRGIHAQMEALPTNLATLARIERESGSLDDFVAADEPLAVARSLSRSTSPTKLEQVGLPIALELLRSVGVDLAKPAALARRTLGPQRLGLAADTTASAAADAVRTVARGTRRSATEVDQLLWIFCAPDQADVCGTDPRCGECRLAAHCREGRRRTGAGNARGARKRRTRE